MKQPQGRRRTQHCVRHLPTVSTTQTTNGDEEREDLPPKAKAKEEERSILLARWAMKRGEAKTNDRHQKAKVRVHYTNYRYLLGLSAASPPPISLYCTKPPTMNPTLRLRTQAIARLSCQRRNLSSSRGQVRRLDTAVRSLGALRLVGPSLRGRQTLAGSSWNVVERRAFHATADLSKEYPEHELLSMPALSPTMEMGTIAEWALKEGDSFGAGSAICSVETDKATMDFEAQDDGFLAKILRQGPDAVDIPCGATIAIVVEDEADVAAFADYVLEAEAPAPAAAAEPAPAAASPSVPAASASTREVSDEFVLLPAARFLAESKGLDATGLPGTGKGGRVTKGDVLSAIQNGTPMPALAAKAAAAAAPAPVASASPIVSAPLEQLPVPSVDSYGTFEDVPNSNMRKIIAKRLTESKRDVPHFYTSMEVELDNIMKLRKQLVANHGIKVSVNDIIIRASAMALRDVPEANGTFDPKSDSVRLQDSIDISIAVATPTGLITPIVPHTDKLGLSQITDKVRDLAGRARDGKLKPEEYQGGTFCISNLGMFGIDEFSAVINPPQAAILAVGGGTRRVVPTPYIEGAEVQAKPSIKTIMTARLSADRRVVDEATAALFMSAFKHYMNKPELLML